MTHSFKQIKEHLQSQPPILLKGVSKADTGGLKTFLQNILVYTKSNDTIFKNGKVQTVKGERRSIGDLYRITYYYFPNVRLTTVYKAMLSLILEKKALSAICSATGMRVYRHAGNETIYFNGEGIDEFGVNFDQFEDYPKCKPAKDYWGYAYGKEQIKFIQF